MQQRPQAIRSRRRVFYYFDFEFTLNIVLIKFAKETLISLPLNESIINANEAAWRYVNVSVVIIQLIKGFI